MPIKCFLIILLLLMTTMVFADCTVTTTPVSFGNYDPFSAIPLDTTGTITVTCDNPPGPPPDVTISISTSSNSGGFIPRQMKHTSRPDLFDYNLYTKQNRTIVWGDGTGGTASVIVKGSKSRKLTIYANIPPQQNVPAGSYTDVLTVTITP